MLPPSPEALPFHLHTSDHQHPPPVIHRTQQVLPHLCQAEPGRTPQPESARATCRGHREGMSLGETLVMCKRHPLPKGIITCSYNPILPHFQPHWGPPLKSSGSLFMLSQSFLPEQCWRSTGPQLHHTTCLAVALLVLTPTHRHSSARPWTFLVVPRLSPTQICPQI